MKEKLLRKLRAFISKYNLIQKNTHIGVAVSGGPDSVFLLVMLDELKNELNLKLSVLHFNHKIRKEADEEENFVKDLSKKLNLNFFSDNVNVRKYRESSKMSLEEAARIKRYEFLSKLKNKLNLDLIATGHTKDDVVETFLINLLRGSSMEGLASLKPKREYFVRPIICFSKKEIEDFLKSTGICYKMDLSNKDITFLRNRIRLELLPFLEKFNPNIKETLFKEILIMYEDIKFLDDFTLAEFVKNVRTKENKVEIDLNNLNYIAIKKRVISLAIRKLTGSNYSPSFNNLERIINQNKVHLRKLIKSNKEHNKLILEKWI